MQEKCYASGRHAADGWLKWRQVCYEVQPGAPAARLDFLRQPRAVGDIAPSASARG